MKNIYFAIALVFLVLLAFTACSTGGNGDDDSSGNSSSGTSSGGNGGSGKSSSSKGGGTGSKAGACYITFNLLGGYADMCFEGITEALTRSDCNEILEEMNDDPEISGAFSVEFMNSCPTTQDYKCYIVDDDVLDEGYAYLYGSFYDEGSCDEFGGIDVTPKQSSSSKKASSSSAGSGSQTGACYLSYSDLYAGNHVCEEGISEPITKALCDYIGEELVNTGMIETYKFQSSCPSGESLRCLNDPIRVYYYGSEFTDRTCSNLGYDDDPAAPKRSSSSAGGGSKSSSSGGTQGACYASSLYEDYNFCIEPISSSYCKIYAELYEDYYDFSTRTSCPKSGYKCTYEEDGINYYFYGEGADESDCEDEGYYNDESGFLAKAKSLPIKGLAIKDLAKKSLYKTKGLYKK